LPRALWNWAFSYTYWDYSAHSSALCQSLIVRIEFGDVVRAADCYDLPVYLDLLIRFAFILLVVCSERIPIQQGQFSRALGIKSGNLEDSGTPNGVDVLLSVRADNGKQLGTGRCRDHNFSARFLNLQNNRFGSFLCKDNGLSRFRVVWDIALMIQKNA